MSLYTTTILSLLVVSASYTHEKLIFSYIFVFRCDVFLFAMIPNITISYVFWSDHKKKKKKLKQTLHNNNGFRSASFLSQTCLHIATLKSLCQDFCLLTLINYPQDFSQQPLNTPKAKLVSSMEFIMLLLTFETDPLSM